MSRVNAIRLTLGTAVLAIWVAACAYGINPITGNRQAYAYTWEQEVELGREADAGILQEYGVYDDPEVLAYVTRVGQGVLQYSHLRRANARPEFQSTEFTFRVLDSPIVNAFALPGGYVYVTRGLLAHVENEAQLAVVIGHEIGHVVARHTSRRTLKSKLGQLGLMGGAIIGQAVLDVPAGELMNLGGSAMQYLLLSYSRDDEREADKLGVEYASMAGYDASQGSDFFRVLKRLQQSSGGGLPEWQSTHPDPGEREHTITRLAAQWHEQGYAMDRVDRDAFYSEVDNIVVGDDPRQGFVANGFFYHPGLKFAFPVPTSWYVANQPTQVQFIEPNTQQAGLIFQMAPDAASPRAAAREFTSSQGVTLISEEPVQVDSYEGYTVVVDLAQQSGASRVRRTFIDFNGTIVDFIGISPASNFSSYDEIFRMSQFGFRNISQDRYANVRPVRIDVEEAPVTAAFRTMVPGDLPAGFTPELLSIMNQVELDDTIPQGRKIKLLSW